MCEKHDCEVCDRPCFTIAYISLQKKVNCQLTHTDSVLA